MPWSNAASCAGVTLYEGIGAGAGALRGGWGIGDGAGAGAGAETALAPVGATWIV